MRKILLLATLMAISATTLLTGCALTLKPYQPPVQQGNVLKPEAVNQLRVGMSTQAVEALLGRPVLQDTFKPGRWTYVYTYRPSRGAYQKKQVILYFHGNRLEHILR
jgi:outer membrane protein assembly factor BamE